MRDTVQNETTGKGKIRGGLKQTSPGLLVAQAKRVFFSGLLYAAALSVCLNLLQLTMPLFMLQVHDRVLNSQSMDTLGMLTILAVGALVVLGVLEFIRALSFQAMGGALVRRLNMPVLAAAVQASVDQGLTRATQSLRDISELRTFLTSSAVSAPLDAAWSPIFLGALFLLHPLFGLIGAVSAALLLCGGLITDILTRQLTKEANQTNIEAVSKIGASLRHAEAIEAMGMLPALAARWRALQLQALIAFETSGSRSKAMSSITRSLRYCIQIITLAAGAFLVLQQEITPGAMMASSILVGRLLIPFDSLIDNWRQWVLAAAAWHRLEAMLTADVAIRQTMPTPHSSGDIVVDKLIYAAPGLDVPIIKGISFSLSPGEVLGVIGPSAAGKSTLARLLVGILRPTSGGVFLDGNNTYLWERSSFGRVVGYLPQSVSLLEGTIRENIGRMADSDPYKVLEAARLADIHEMVGRLPLGYDTPVGDGHLTLSGGQRQRIALARCLYDQPRLIVLDEPNANLDAIGERALIRAIERARESGAIVIIIAHRPAIMQVADKLLVLENGRITQFGPRTSVVAATMPGETTREVAAI
ncbi:type I secretion system permease/ATPase [Neorhizobium galegae]|uniref:type I secretion system permease/ATPase n=1 Tax=Neorhizobium galegae TaxID=399 RepID=UPI00062290E5|nr:type I secretion system permease/ATPase [Neorhizobium galegae]CDZ28587.1 Alkaline protease secretion ATP-binding protein AprD [Neorhizobium galegae bv. officinalis]KAA9383908.1 type I secretion system permease/ATPase [Neorhizobium galegae]MCM2496798.1 type I secretion system permease/ATPase [Neorhizobium galegae]MCQ1769192.1 type I secretion system permease/ATPase [Neorhizobium galegae]MCQ1774992.1 type I secretion system permease/ATPase [Neorhizobium galegae]